MKGLDYSNYLFILIKQACTQTTFIAPMSYKYYTKQLEPIHWAPTKLCQGKHVCIEIVKIKPAELKDERNLQIPLVPKPPNLPHLLSKGLF